MGTLPDVLPPLSFVMPVLNEERYVEGALRSVLRQQYPAPTEVVVALGPSTDRTDEIVRRLAAEDGRIRMVQVEQAVIATSLNRAIAAAQYPVIARVDAHVELPFGYARQAVETLVREGVDNVGGIMTAVGESPFQRAVALGYNSRWGLGGGAYHLADAGGGEVESTYLGVFRADAVAAVGGYDETLARGEDWELNHRLRQSGRRVWLDPALRVVYRPRASQRDLARQMRATGAWRAVLVRRLGAANSRRFFAPPALVACTGTAVLSGAAAAAGLGGPPVRWLAATTAAGSAAHLGVVGAVAARSGGTPGDRLRFAAVLITMHYAWGAGFLDAFVRGANRVLDRSRIRPPARVRS
jgi:GT2 family glycosyltransferase